MIRSKTDIRIAILVLEDEIKLLNSRIEAHDTGHLYTTISVLNNRLDELIKELDNA